MKKWMRTACLALTGLAMAVSLTGCNPKVKDKVVDDSTSTVGGIETQTHIITDTFSIPIPSSCRGVEDKLNTDLYTWVPTPEGEHIPKDTDFVRVEVAALDDVDAADKGFAEHGFEDATDSNLHYHYETLEEARERVAQMKAMGSHMGPDAAAAMRPAGGPGFGGRPKPAVNPNLKLV